ncbi:MAG: hypothetical protein AABZ31_15000, partial [Bdellovibrionota bacterium]
MASSDNVIKPNPGPQEAFLATDADIAIFGGSAGCGKALTLDTPIPTANGWKTMGALRAGDVLFDERGQPCRVILAHAAYEPQHLYALRF